ncbi:imidazole glycerol phosphate synthase subunit HisH [Neolewinella lacunae]|uniref:Imidazole glycerol phosphate synthase subunit HisH n=1 Tax=Neolewinella lacunae TaxID=1517758 RepID=A0A923PQL0_9BACT|nr:imidazole glycerol phosphate synthase subunit HisH [Neolewinella lacunae]MBC6995643.1 imidazole glycerol phosphate synthase subunit HisH [Neolewinella lacunae]MDN3634290.1 imidazole glycerol phosphate synthase subunit HisH [Neolewinella lacunae]
MIAVINYNAGNIRSVLYALERIGVEHILTSDHDVIRSAEKVIFPGVGAAASTMAHLNATGLTMLIRNLEQPVFGICVGMQLLCSHSEEGDVPCIGVFPEKVKRFRPNNGDKVPHMGWNNIRLTPENDWVSDAVNEQYCYYVHSYYVEPGPHTVATTEYCGITYAAMLRKDNFYAAQFHPEKSALVGERILRDFLAAQ